MKAYKSFSSFRGTVLHLPRLDAGYGYSPVGERFYDLKSGRQQRGINMIAEYRKGQLIAPFTIEGACNRSVFETWLETCLMPLVSPSEWVIVNNATFHHGGWIAQLIETAGCKLVYLSPIHSISIRLKSVGLG